MGANVGPPVGISVGKGVELLRSEISDGKAVGKSVGISVGTRDGLTLGTNVGRYVGADEALETVLLRTLHDVQ